MHAGAYDIGHDIAGREYDGACLDLAIIGQTDLDRTSGRIECNGFRLKQPCTARSCGPQQPERQLQRIGIGRARRNQRARTRDAEIVEQHRMIEKRTRQTRARATAMFLAQACVAFLRGEIQGVHRAHVAGDA